MKQPIRPTTASARPGKRPWDISQPCTPAPMERSDSGRPWEGYEPPSENEQRLQRQIYTLKREITILKLKLRQVQIENQLALYAADDVWTAPHVNN